MTILESHNFRYTADSLQQLHTECNLPFNHLKNIRVYVIVARQHPQHLDITVTKKITPETKATAVEEAKAAATKQSDGSDDFQLLTVVQSTKGFSRSII